MGHERTSLAIAIALALTLAAAITSAQPPPTTRASRAHPPASSEPAVLTPAPFQLGATRAQAVRACNGTAEDDSGTAITCNPDEVWPGAAHQPYVVGTLCGSRVCRIDVVILDPVPAADIAAAARAASARLATGFGPGEHGGDDAACATAFFGGDDACLRALAPGRTIWRRWTIPGGGWLRVRLRAMANGSATYLESYLDARAEAAAVSDPDA